MGQAKKRGSFEQRKAESVARREVEYKARPTTIRPRRRSGINAILAIVGAGLVGGHRNG